MAELKWTSVLGKSASALVVAGSTMGTATYVPAYPCARCAGQYSCYSPAPTGYGCIFYNGVCTTGSVYCS